MFYAPGLPENIIGSRTEKNKIKITENFRTSQITLKAIIFSVKRANFD